MEWTETVKFRLRIETEFFIRNTMPGTGYPSEPNHGSTPGPSSYSPLWSLPSPLQYRVDSSLPTTQPPTLYPTLINSVHAPNTVRSSHDVLKQYECNLWLVTWALWVCGNIIRKCIVKFFNSTTSPWGLEVLWIQSIRGSSCANLGSALCANDDPWIGHVPAN